MGSVPFLGLAPALIITPWLLARQACKTDSLSEAIGAWGLLAIGLNSGVPIALHLLGQPITGATLTGAHALLALPVLLLTLLRPRRFIPAPDPSHRPLYLLAAVFAVITIPVTPMAGIDTYKWADLASVVAVEHRIAWWIHPLSPFGFTPRSYSSAQPLILASFQLLAPVGMGGGFYLVSLVFGATGLFGAWRLARAVFARPDAAVVFAGLYTLAPVFMRYHYWPTGRGLVMALLPFFILSLLRLNRLAGVAGCAGTALLLGLAHKAGLVAVAVLPAGFAGAALAGLCLRPLTGSGRLGRLAVGLGCLAPSVAVGLLLAGGAPELAYRLVTRFGLLLPLGLLALVPGTGLGPATPGLPAFILGAGALAAIPLAAPSDMYGALLALPFAAFAATAGWDTLISWLPPRRRRPGEERFPTTRGPRNRPGPRELAGRVLFILALVQAVIIVVNQAQDSPSWSLVRAARFLNLHDPLGPYRIEAPGRARARLQGYLTGCPRFTVTGGAAAPTLLPPPSGVGPVAARIRHWTGYLRGAFVVPDAGTDWYGPGGKVYYVTVEGQGVCPADARLLYQDGGIAVFEAAPLNPHPHSSPGSSSALPRPARSFPTLCL
jgi:hypothetical protein